MIDMVQKRSGCLLHHVENVLETRRIAVVGIRNFILAQMRRELEQQMYTALQAARADSEKIFVVLAIHRQQVIKFPEIVFADTPCTVVGQIDAAAQGGKTGIGEGLSVATGNVARFEIPEDALYARVTITSSKGHGNPSFPGQKKQAWTQPVGWRQ